MIVLIILLVLFILLFVASLVFNYFQYKKIATYDDFFVDL